MCLQVCHLHRHLYFCTVEAGSSHMLRFERGTGCALNWQVYLWRKLTHLLSLHLSLQPSSLCYHGHKSGMVAGQQIWQGGSSLGAQPPAESTCRGTDHPTPGAMPTPHPPAKRHHGLFRMTGFSNNEENCFKSDDGFHFTLMSRSVLYPYL